MNDLIQVKQDFLLPGQSRWEIDPLSDLGSRLRPNYTALPENWQNHKHTNPENTEKSIREICRKLLKRGIIPTKLAPKPKKTIKVTPNTIELIDAVIPKATLDLLEKDDTIDL